MSETEPFQKLQICEVCNATNAKYTCPKCEVRTCSLPCSNIHKKELECDGIRNKVIYKPIPKMTNLDLLSDYRLIEEVTRSVESYRKEQLTKIKQLRRFQVRPFKLLKAAAEHGVRLQFLPPTFTRNKENSTYLDWKTQVIQWRLEWIFAQAENTKYINERVFESERLGILLDEYLDPRKCEKATRDTLLWYQAAGNTGVVLLLRAESIVKSGSRFYELDAALTLKENLKGKTIIEHPTILVVLKSHKDMYDILDPEEELQIEAENAKICQSNTRKRDHSRPEDDDADKGDAGLDEESGAKKVKLDTGIPMYEDLINTTTKGQVAKDKVTYS